MANATAEPPEEPAQVNLGLKGLPVAPKTKFRVFAPAPNSGVLVLPKIIPPSFLILLTTT